MWAISKAAHPTQHTCTATSKGTPKIYCPISPHCNTHQVLHTKCTTTYQYIHVVKSIPPGHAIPGFPTIFYQGPNCPLVHSCNSPSHSSTQRRDRGVTIIPPYTSPSQIPKKLEESYCNEIGRLCQGIGTRDKCIKKKRVAGTETSHIIQYEDVPTDKRKGVTYTNVVW